MPLHQVGRSLSIVINEMTIVFSYFLPIPWRGSQTIVPTPLFILVTDDKKGPLFIKWWTWNCVVVFYWVELDK